MDWYKNLKINKKLLIAFSLTIFVSLIFGVFAISTLLDVSGSYHGRINQNLEVVKKIDELKESVYTYVIDANSLILHTANNSNVSDISDEMENMRELVSEKLEWYKQYLKDKSNKEEYMTFIDNLIDNSQKYFDAMDNAIELAKNGSTKDAINIIDKNYSFYEELLKGCDIISGSTINNLIKNANKINNYSNTAVLVLIGILFFLICVSISIALFVSWFIRKPIIDLEKAAMDVCNGNFDVVIKSKYKDELGNLSNSIGKMMSILKSLLNEINDTSKLLHNGETDVRINGKNYLGAYNSVAESINNVIDELLDDTDKVIECIQGYGNGNFDAKIKRFPGKKNEINVALDAIRNNFVSISEDINSMINAAIKGELEYTIDSSSYQGDWNNIANGLNTVLRTVKKPLISVSDTLKQLADGNFKVKIEESFSGDFEVMKNNLNNTIEIVSDYIQDISDILIKLSKQDLSVEIKKNYIGDFEDIQNALNLILLNFNSLLREIGNSANSVADNAKNISGNSSKLVEGAASQNNSVYELNSMIKNISENSTVNSEKSQKVNEIALAAQNYAVEGSQKMRDMLSAMKEINDAAESISNIIDVIDDIAFQTNILALNAAVEAARAGDSGKGFAVVADEVRSLAGRSQRAAKETGEFINSSLAKIEFGVEIANTTSDSLNLMIEQVKEIAVLIDECAIALKDEASALDDISQSVSDISEVARDNNSLSIRSEEFAEALVKQAAVFKSAVDNFILK